jgi:molybdopterin-guanine dinucleotide biosynthesis protein A
MDFDAITKICEQYGGDDLVVSLAFPDGGTEPLMARLERAANNQAENGLATFSRYGIWANTVRDNIREAIALLERDGHREAIPFLVKSANSLSAFSDIQRLAEIEQNKI